jgi:hypothetical protein
MSSETNTPTEMTMSLEMNRTENDITPEALAHLGDGRIAYVKAIRSEDVAALFPQMQVPKLAPGVKLFALHAADGTPIMLTDSREAAVANAWSQELETVSVHGPGIGYQGSGIKMPRQATGTVACLLDS